MILFYKNGKLNFAIDRIKDHARINEFQKKGYLIVLLLNNSNLIQPARLYLSAIPCNIFEHWKRLPPDVKLS